MRTGKYDELVDLEICFFVLDVTLEMPPEPHEARTPMRLCFIARGWRNADSRSETPRIGLGSVCVGIMTQDLDLDR